MNYMQVVLVVRIFFASVIMVIDKQWLINLHFLGKILLGDKSVHGVYRISPGESQDILDANAQ